MKKRTKQLLAALWAVLVLLSVIPLSAIAAPASDIPKDMLDNVFLDALAYTGYDVQAQKNDGSIFIKYSSMVSASVRSDIGYGTGPDGTETITKSGTATGKAPDIALFEKNGLCCATYISYVYFNYLPNIAGIDTSDISRPTNLRSSTSYNNAMNSWVSAGKAKRISFTQNANGTGFTPAEPIPIGSIVIFKSVETGGIAHSALYMGYYKGQHFVAHVASDNGPEFCTITAMAKAGEPQAVVQVVSPPMDVSPTGKIEVYKKDTGGKALAGAVFVATSTADSTLQFRIGPTDSKGYASVKDVPYGTYKVTETVFPANHTYSGKKEWTVTLDSSNDGEVTVQAVNQLKKGTIEVQKTDAVSGNHLAGAEFTVYDKAGKTVTVIGPTDTKGYAKSAEISYGSYTVKETKFPAHYQAGKTTSWDIVLQDATPSIKLTVSNERQAGELKVTKTSEDGFVEGIQFRLTGTSAYGSKVNLTAYTDATGVAHFTNVPVGTGYVLSEGFVDVRYVLTADQTVNIEWNKVTNASFHNALKKWRADVLKIDRELSGADVDALDEQPVAVISISDNEDDPDLTYGKSQGDGSLAGAVYGVYHNGQLVETYTTDENGYFLTDYFPCDENGSWTMQEISPSPGYLLDDTVYWLNTSGDYFSGEYNTIYLDCYEVVKKGTIHLVKHTDEGDGHFDTPEAGATFEIYLSSAGSYDASEETERERLTTDKYGVAVSKELPFGAYTVRQVSGKEGYAFIPTFEVFIQEHSECYTYILNDPRITATVEIVKQDAETGKIIPVSGIGFQVKDLASGAWITQSNSYPTPMEIDTFYTDATGKLRLPEKLPYGQYELVERHTANGYVLDSTPVSFTVDGTKETVTVVKSNIPQKGTITITKTGEVFSSVTETDGIYQPVYAETGLQGAVFTVTAAEDVYTADGTRRYAQGETVDTVTTGADGIATTKALYLGSYRITETNAPYGMVLLPEPVTATLTYAGQEVAITATAVTLQNTRQKLSLDLHKMMEVDDLFHLGGNGEVQNVQFGLYAADILTASDGKSIPKDGLMEVASCDAEGKITFSTDLPVGAAVYAKEYATDEHYILSDTAYPVEFVYAGQTVAEVQIHINDGKAIVNSLIRGTIIGKKVDEDGFAIAGTRFGLFSPDTTDFTDENALLVSVSNEIGIFWFEDVPFGKWLIKELQAAPAFVLNDSVFEVFVTEDEQVIQLEAENDFIVGTVQTTKVDKDYPENTLSGAVFVYFVDVDGNRQFDTEIDLCIGELTETAPGIYRAEDLRYNGYFLHEKQAPTGFIKDDGYYYFEIRENGETVIVENKAGIGIANQPIKGHIRIQKKDADTDEALSGVEFGLFDAKGKEIARGTTDADGSVLFENIRFGSYTLRELSPKDGYYQNEEVYTAEITEDGVTLTYEVTNKKIPPEPPRSPQTGDRGCIRNLWAVFILLFTACIAIPLLLLIRKRHK